MRRVLRALVAVCALPACASSAARSTSPAAPPTSVTTTAAGDASQPVSTTAVSTPATQFEPDGLAFWDRQHGLLVGTDTTVTCRSGAQPCTRGAIERTDDGGATWQIVDRTDGPLDAVTTSGQDVAWVPVARCGPASPDACATSTILETTDGGLTWHSVATKTPVTSLTATSATDGWAVSDPMSSSGLSVPTLLRTDDSGRTWQGAPNPCSEVQGVTIWSVAFAGAADGWVVCTSEPATATQPKVLFSTTDGGTSWQLRAGTCVRDGADRPAPAKGDLPCDGYLPGMTFRPDGHGWLWASRATLVATSDRGTTWQPIAEAIDQPDVNQVIAADLVSDRSGALIVRRPDHQDFALESTTDAGQTWTVVHHWPAN